MVNVWDLLRQRYVHDLNPFISHLS